MGFQKVKNCIIWKLILLEQVLVLVNVTKRIIDKLIFANDIQYGHYLCANIGEKLRHIARACLEDHCREMQRPTDAGDFILIQLP